ncbi:UDP-N-acetylglucosamine 1-carboxyvinyltransferase [Nakamurella flava]|uniref:UDP-N-acetylglucosamine 1-carboxyvinyltransferase n=1 Tax=Nakamurella flava TaxID=2576308 RepID=A0A4U6QL97_9ACTN|nr:UDP-N-acetylglucosamine 1-carboxyvinyltransferase [Nakamurella flava]TKV61069.1 UDP-N-acetylglucosamine 1-carboxyvinyltransferase [Nakamurella flava]
MERFVVTGGARLEGSVEVAGAKNSVLKLMAAALLAEGTTTITNCPEILDVPLMADVLRGLGCDVVLDGQVVTIDTPAELSWSADFPAVGRLRASVCVLGPLMGRCGRARVALPGGDAIGSRPLDMHQSGLRKLGAEMGIEHGQVVGRADRLRGAEIGLDFPSVGATENILTAAVLAEGITVIDNAAREPEIIDLVQMLQQMGAEISGAGTATITIQGVDRLQPTRHHTVGDRVVGGTWAYAAAITRGSVRVIGVDPVYMGAPLERLVQAGADVELDPENGITTVTMNGRPRAVDFITMPYPGFPTDLQPMALALAAVADGHSLITENVFEARFRFVDELIRMGADARTDGHHASIRGREQLSSAPVWSTDIRAGAGLVLAGLAAEGVTEVHEVGHIDRGYPHFVEDLQKLGGQIQRVTDEPAGTGVAAAPAFTS